MTEEIHINEPKPRFLLKELLEKRLNIRISDLQSTIEQVAVMEVAAAAGYIITEFRENGVMIKRAY